MNDGAAVPSAGEVDLDTLLARLEPVRSPSDAVFVTLPPGTSAPEGVTPLVTVVEAEGTTLVLDPDRLDGWHVPSLDGSPRLAHLTLTVHSSLEAVGLTAAVARALGAAGISCNVVAGYHHDHLFVPVARADEALAVLRSLSEPNGPDEPG